jgi:hypothetical protein
MLNNIISLIVGLVLGFLACYLGRKTVAKENKLEDPQYIWSKTPPAEFLDGRDELKKIEEQLNETNRE